MNISQRSDLSIFALVKSELELRPSRSQLPSASANDTSRRHTFLGVTNAIEPDHASRPPEIGHDDDVRQPIRPERQKEDAVFLHQEWAQRRHVLTTLDLSGQEVLIDS
jgi:hypothetical protein